MRLFTFSGITLSPMSVNDGTALKGFAQDVLDNFGSTIPNYDSTDEVGHFRSYINLIDLLSDLMNASHLNGSEVLNREARLFAEKYGTALNDAMAQDPTEDLLILAHSQGNNNLVFALKYLFQNAPAFFAQRKIRCAMLDPKVGQNHVEDIIALDTNGNIEMLFLQSENDLILGNQAIFVPKLIDTFPHGNHIWVRGADHGTIHEWKTYSTTQSWLSLPEYGQFIRDCGKERIRLKQEFGTHLNTVYLEKLQAFRKKYKMNQDKLSAALLGFLKGNLLKKFQS